MRIQTTNKPWNKRRFLRSLAAAALAFGVFLPVQVSAEEADDTLVEAQTNENNLSYLELVDSFVTAERTPTKRLKTPANVHVITAAEIEANHYQDISEALSHVPGAIISNTNTLMLNGNQHVLILVDGVRVNNDQSMFAVNNIARLTGIPSMKNIERIEILKGGASALYGSNAAGGVVNIITKKGQFNETTLDLNFGSWSRQNYELTNQGVAGDRFSWFITGGFHKSDDYKYGGNPRNDSSDSDYKDNTFTVRLDNRFDDNNSLTFNYLHRKHKYNDGGWFRGEVISGINEKYDSFYLSYNFKEETPVPGWLRYFNTKTSDGYYGDSRLQGVDYQNGWEFGQHSVIVGLEYHQTKASSEDLNFQNGKMTNKAFYVQDAISLGDKWTVIPGVRYDHNKNSSQYIPVSGVIVRDIYNEPVGVLDMGDIDYSSKSSHQWSPKLAVNYRADEQTKIYASWGKVFRAPTIAEIYSHDYPYLGGWLWTSPLTPEKGHTEIIGLEHEFSDDMNVNVNFFNTKLDDVINWKIQTIFEEDGLQDLAAFVASNTESQKQRGFEIVYRQKVNDNWGYDLGYTHTHMEGSTDIFPNSYRVGLHYANGAWKANLLGIMTSGLKTYNNDVALNTSGKWAIFDFNTSYDLNDSMTIYARALNLTNKNHASENAIYPSPGRFFQIGAQFKF